MTASKTTALKQAGQGEVADGRRTEPQALLKLNDLVKRFTVRRGPFARTRSLSAVNHISLEVMPGETFALVGESGCGKTTVGRMVAGLESPTGGEIHYRGVRMDRGGRESGDLRREIQMIFQDPYASLNPRLKVWESVAEPLIGFSLVPRCQTREKVAELFSLVGLRADQLDRFPHELSGGQRQRVGIARALAAEPRLIVADEPVSALDVSIQAQILNLMREIHGRLQIAYLFISHDLGVVAYISTRVAVMYLGEIVETGATRDVLSNPRHPYTRELLASVPRRAGGAGSRQPPLEGDLPSPLDPPTGCRFHPRCRECMPVCAQRAPEPETMPDGSVVRCHLYK